MRVQKASISELEDGSGFWVTYATHSEFYSTIEAAITAVAAYFRAKAPYTRE